MPVSLPPMTRAFAPPHPTSCSSTSTCRTSGSTTATSYTSIGAVTDVARRRRRTVYGEPVEALLDALNALDPVGADDAEDTTAPPLLSDPQRDALVRALMRREAALLRKDADRFPALDFQSSSPSIHASSRAGPVSSHSPASTLQTRPPVKFALPMTPRRDDPSKR